MVAGAHLILSSIGEFSLISYKRMCTIKPCATLFTNFSITTQPTSNTIYVHAARNMRTRKSKEKAPKYLLIDKIDGTHNK